MTKAKKKPGKKASPRATGVAKKTDEIRKIRNQVRNVILNGSVKMAERIVRTVNEEGSVSGLKFLWETAALFPSGSAEEDSTGEETLAKMILKALEMPTEPPSDDEEERNEEDETNAEGDVESEEPEEMEAEVGSSL